MHILTYLFLFALTCSVLIQIWLARRQIHSVESHRDSVPDSFKDSISMEQHAKAADYTITKLRFGYSELAYGTLLLLVWTLGGGLELLDNLGRELGLSALYTGTVFILSAIIIMGLLDLPFAIYRTFVIEQRFGFNHSSLKLFIMDHIKQTGLLIAIGTPLIMLVLWLMDNAGQLWWLYVWVVWFSFSMLMMWAYPVFIAPIFNKFAPLEDSPLRTQIENLLQRTGFRSKGIFVIDGSRRSGHSNAYFTGLGENKRIVFFDTLMQSLDGDELESVLAHELGHFKHKHIHKNILLTAVISLIGLALLGWLISKPWFYSALGVQTQSIHVALLLFMIVMPVFTFFLQPDFMRRHEFEADDFAASQTDARNLITALVKLYTENASTLTPDPVYSAFYDSHPPAPVRISHLTAKMDRVI